MNHERDFIQVLLINPAYRFTARVPSGTCARKEENAPPAGARRYAGRHQARLTAGTAFCAFAFFGWPAFAQTGIRAPVVEAASSDRGLEEIVVTARRREEKLQTVPIAISAVSGEMLTEHSIANAVDLGKLVPALNTAQTNRDLEGYEIRGMSNNNASAQGQSPTVTPYFAEVPFPVGDGAGVGRFYDLENVQILKGPQGTLFGRNSSGGAVLMVPKKPTDDYDGYVQAQFGNYNDRQFQGAANIPIDSKLLVRFAGERAERDGFTKDLLNGKDLDNRDYWAGRVSVTLRPTDNFENDLIADSLYSDSNGSSEVLGYLNPGAVFGTINLGPFGSIPLTFGNGPLYTGLLNPATQIATAIAGIKAGAFALFPGAELNQIQSRQQALGPREVNAAGGNPIEKIISQGIADTARLDLADNITLRNIFGYRLFKQLVRASDDGTPLSLLQAVQPNGWNVDLAQYSEELQLQGKSFDGGLVWVAGAFGLFSHPAGLNQDTTLEFGSPVYTQNGPTTRSEAVYAQATYDLGHSFDFLEGLKFTAGYRFTWDYRQLNLVEKNATGGCSALGADRNCNLSLEYHGSEPSWDVGLDYQLTADTLLYVTSRRGFRAGGLNSQSLIASQTAFKPETVLDEEIGIKSDWSLYGVKARTNLAAFHSDYKNKQASEAYAAVVNGTLVTPNLIVNAGNATIQGVETDLTVVPFDNLELTASWAYTQAYFDRYLIIATGQNVPGETYPFVPKNKLSFGARYHLPLPEEYGAVSVGAILATQSHQYLGVSPGDPPQTTIGSGYTTLDLNLNWTGVLNSPVDVSLFATNVTDTVYKLGGYPIYGLAGFASFVYGEPQMYGARIKYRFGGPVEAAPETAAYTPPAAVAPASPVARSYMVFFDFNRSDLTPQAAAIVDQAAKNAALAKATELTVTGHTDTVGSDAYNMRLSRRRAESVAEELQKQGIAAGEIEIVAKGKRDLLVPTGDGVREPQNRRVQIVYDAPAA